MRRIAQIVPLILVLFALAGCLPFVLGTDQPCFSSDEYRFPQVEGRYVFDSLPEKSATLSRSGNGADITLYEKGDQPPSTLMGGFIPLRIPGYFIFQATDMVDAKGKSDKEPGETTYFPAHVDAGGVTWYSGPKNCFAECDALFAAHGYTRDERGGWREPTSPSADQIKAFYEDLAELMERLPADDAWESLRMTPSER